MTKGKNKGMQFHSMYVCKVVLVFFSYLLNRKSCFKYKNDVWSGSPSQINAERDGSILYLA